MHNSYNIQFLKLKNRFIELVCSLPPCGAAKAFNRKLEIMLKNQTIQMKQPETPEYQIKI